MNALIQGASRGIGLALVRELLDRGAERVFATSRSFGSSLEALERETEGRLKHLQLELKSESSIAAAAVEVEKHCAQLHLLINVSGLLHSETIQPERRIEHVDAGALAESFAVNATGPILVAKHFRSLLTGPERAVFASVSARVGSISDNRLGGWYGYRASKAAQNMMTKTLSIELARRAPNVICVALHPGTVDTDLSKPFQRNVPPHQLFDVERAAKQLLAVIDPLTSADSGSFLDWASKPIAW